MNVVGHALAVGHAGDRARNHGHRRQHAARAVRLVQLGEDQPLDAVLAVAPAGRGDLAGAGGGGQHQVHLDVGHRAQQAHLAGDGRCVRAAGGVDQHQVRVGRGRDRRRQRRSVARHVRLDPHDLAVPSQVLARPHPVCIDGYQRDP